jgi:hypothetical protein
MGRLLVLAVCAVLVSFARAEEPDPEPPTTDSVIRKLDDAVRNEAKIGRDKVEARRKAILAQLEKRHAALLKRGQADRARTLKDRMLLAESIRSGQGLDSKLPVKRLLDRASGKGRYRELLHVLYVPGDKRNYTEYTDFGVWSGNAYAGYNALKSGYWVYVYPRWYIWKEIKPGK